MRREAKGAAHARAGNMPPASSAVAPRIIVRLFIMWFIGMWFIGASLQAFA
ncbi:hypothetical protein SFOMI_2951 [Sphingobium fuliginis]|jgi:hypothetical protein|uniref:Uncharacterized protein n=1 Tax=Sphingobium fuliginis (strain ATCC 27551) TaxID=336203 RepID=A0A292ZHX2_SPHSA|nr:hypothetical protein SFOMI_2951 [Sphingobium fuliginis]